MRRVILFTCVFAALSGVPLVAEGIRSPVVAPPSQPAHGPGGGDYRHAAVKESKSGRGGRKFHLFEPAGPVPATAPVIVFLHGWTAIDPWLYGAWISHMARRGNIVIHPRY